MTDQSYNTYLHLFAASSEKRITDIVKNKCIDEEAANFDEILKSWQRAKESLTQIETQDAGSADNCKTFDLHSDMFEQINKNPSIRNTFSKYNSEFKMVELDNMIAPQRQVLLDYVDQIAQDISENPTEDELIRLCIIPQKQVLVPEAKQKGSKNWIFTAQNKDFRYLGGYLKKRITNEDYDLTNVGGIPTHAIVLFVGYGIGCMNAFSVNDRIILTNGFHRAYALRKKGIKKIPILLKKVSADSLKNKIKGLKKDYLLNHPRPVLIKDFFNDDLVRVFKRKKTTTVLNLRCYADKKNIV